MANTLTVLIPKILAGVVQTLRQNAVTPTLVNRAYSLAPSQKGSSITIPIGVAQTASDVTPSNSFPSNTDSTPTSVTLSLSKWKYTKFYLSDQDMTRIDAERNFIPAQLSEAVKALANQVDSDLLGEYKGVYSAAGTAGTTPFASDATAWTTGARKLLNETLAPVNGRKVVLDPDAEANAINLQAFQSAAWRGSETTIREGEIGRVLGADWYMNQNIPSHTKGTLTASANIAVDGAHSAGVSSVTLKDSAATSLTGTLVEGDIITFAGDSQQYVITADATAASNSITASISPTLQEALSGDEVVTLVDSHTVNLAFHPNAFAFASAPLQDAVIEGLGQEFGVVQDPISGLVFRVTVARQFMQTSWYLDVLYGVKLVRAELAARIMG